MLQLQFETCMARHYDMDSITTIIFQDTWSPVCQFGELSPSLIHDKSLYWAGLLFTGLARRIAKGEQCGCQHGHRKHNGNQPQESLHYATLIPFQGRCSQPWESLINPWNEFLQTSNFIDEISSAWCMDIKMIWCIPNQAKLIGIMGGQTSFDRQATKRVLQ